MDNTTLKNFIALVKDIAEKIVALLYSFEEWKAYFFGEDESSEKSE